MTSTATATRMLPCLLATASFAGAALVSGTAAARTAIDLSLGAEASYVNRLGPVTFDDGLPRLRPPAHTTFQRSGAVTFVGGMLDTTLVIDNAWLVPLVGGTLDFAVGSSSAVRSASDGSIVELRPWTTRRAQVFLGGLGARVHDGRWLFTFALRPGFTQTWTQGSAAYGDASYTLPSDGQASSFLLRADVEACRRLDPVERVCLYVAPNVYEFGFLNGGALGLRYDFGW